MSGGVVMGSNTRWGVGLCLAAIVIGAGLGLAGDRQPGARSPTASHVVDRSRPRVQSITVHVSGWVVEPGVVEVPEGSIVADAIAAAGGARPGAGLDGINLAEAGWPATRFRSRAPESKRLPRRAQLRPAGDGLISLNRADATPAPGSARGWPGARRADHRLPRVQRAFPSRRGPARRARDRGGEAGCDTRPGDGSVTFDHPALPPVVSRPWIGAAIGVWLGVIAVEQGRLGLGVAAVWWDTSQSGAAWPSPPS